MCTSDRPGEGRESEGCSGEVLSQRVLEASGWELVFQLLALGLGCWTTLLLMANGGGGDMCDGEGVLLCRCAWWLGEEGCWDLGRALGGKWYPPGTHNPKAALRVLVCTASSQTPENHVQKSTAWTVGAKRSLGLSHASD